MKILYIGHERELSGASRSLLEVMHEVSAKHGVHVLSAYRRGPFADAVRTAGYPLVSVPFYRWRLHFKGDAWVRHIKKNIYRLFQGINYLCLPYLIYYVKKEKIDLIHTNTTSTHMGCMLSRYTGLPHVLHVREFGEEDFDMAFLWDERKCYQIFDRYTDHIIYISHAVKEKYQGKLKKEHTVIYNGVGEEYLRKGYMRNGQHRPLELLIAGRIEPAKGQQEAIQAIACLAERGIRDVRLHVAGSGDAGELRELVQKYGVEDQVIFMGYQTDMPAVRERMDVELVCSACEAFGRVTVEAFMSGMPVIGSDAGGTKELIRPEVNGLLYRPGDPGQLADQIQRLYENPSWMESMSRHAMTFAREYFTAERNGRDILKIYEDKINHSI